MGSAIEKASKGETVLGGRIASRVVHELRGFLTLAGRPSEDEPLSEREIEVAKLVGRGASNAELARELYISEGTAKNHVSKILRKLGLKDRTQLAIHAAQRGWTERP